MGIPPGTAECTSAYSDSRPHDSRQCVLAGIREFFFVIILLLFTFALTSWASFQLLQQPARVHTWAEDHATIFIAFSPLMVGHCQFFVSWDWAEIQLPAYRILLTYFAGPSGVSPLRPIPWTLPLEPYGLHFLHPSHELCRSRWRGHAAANPLGASLGPVWATFFVLTSQTRSRSWWLGPAAANPLDASSGPLWAPC